MRLEGHGRAADDDVEILGEPLRIARHQRRDDGVGLHALAHLAERPRALDEPPVPRDPEVHLHQIARVRARLRDERLALLGDQRLVLVAAQDHVEAGGPGERSVGGHPLMGDRHDELRPARPQPRRRLPARDARIDEDDVGARARDPRGLGRREPEEADREAIEGQEEVGPRAAEDTPGGSVHHVGRQPRELRLGHALAEHVGAEVELVVAEGREVEPDRIERRDHLRAAQHPGLDGRRQRVAREDEDGVRVLSPRLVHERRQARDAPALPPVHGLEDVQVVDLEQRDSDEVGIAGAEGRARGEERRRQDEDEQRGPEPGARGHRSGQPGARDRSSLPVMVGPARDALREIALRAVRVPCPEACLVERVVKDVALGAAPA